MGKARRKVGREFKLEAVRQLVKGPPLAQDGWWCGRRKDPAPKGSALASASEGVVGARLRLSPACKVETLIYTFCMAERAKLFKNGGSQAVRLPKACRFPDDQQEVVVRKVGHRVVLEPVDAWPKKFLACMGAWSAEIPRPKEEPIRRLRDPFA